LLLVCSTGIRVFSDWWIGTYSYSDGAKVDAPRYVGIYIALTFSASLFLLASGMISPFISAIAT
jgi:hypothetical protein